MATTAEQGIEEEAFIRVNTLDLVPVKRRLRLDLASSCWSRLCKSDN